MRLCAFTLKCDVSGGLTAGRAQKITLKETILWPIDWGLPPQKRRLEKGLLWLRPVKVTKQYLSILGFTSRNIKLNRQNC